MKLGYKLSRHLVLIKKVKIRGYFVSISFDGKTWEPENDLRLDTFKHLSEEFGMMEFPYGDGALIDETSINLAKKIINVLKERKHQGSVVFTLNDRYDDIESVSFE